MPVPLHILQTTLDGLLAHARDGANRIQNGHGCEADHAGRVIARNVSETLSKALRVLSEATK